MQTTTATSTTPEAPAPPPRRWDAFELAPPPSLAEVTAAAAIHTGNAAAPQRGSRLLKAHTCTVAFPDGTDGTARYERLGPACHRFDFRYQDGATLPHKYLLSPLGNTPAAIEAKARELAPGAFAEAIERERREYFARVTEPTDGSRKADPARYALTPAQAKTFGGRYALCLPMPASGKLLRVSPVAATFDEAAAAWRGRTDPRHVVACCNRLDRRFEQLKYSPLHAEGHPRRSDETA